MRLLPLCGAVVLAACSAEARPAPQETPAHAIRVIDGDTVSLHGERFRLSNIDAPELPPASKCWAEAGLAVAASNQLQEFVNISPTYEIRREGRDRYGRTLGRLVLAGHDVGEAMIDRGLAAQWTGHKWDWCAPASYGTAGAPNVIGNGPEANGHYSEWSSKILSARVLSPGR